MESPPTSDLCKQDGQEGEVSAVTEISPRTGSEIASSELYDDNVDESMIVSSNSTELFEPLVLSESDVSLAFSSEMQQARDHKDLGSFPLLNIKEESAHLITPGESK